MSELKINGNINDILGAIDHLNGKTAYPVYIPSLKRSVMFKEMTTGQEKTIVKTIIDNPIYNSGFIFAIRDIIKQNCMEDIDIDSLTVIDKTAICLVMRQKSIGDTFEYTFKGTKKKKTISISEYIERFKPVKIPDDKIVGNDHIKVVCGYPTILDEYSLEHEFHSNVSAMEVKTSTEMKEAIGEVFINEVVKYIKKISIVRDNDEMVLDMKDFNFKNRIQIIEKIGNTVLTEILKYIQSANEKVNDALLVDLQLTKKEQEEAGIEKLTGILGAGSDFFITS
jgi:hypothetical protein